MEKSLGDTEMLSQNRIINYYWDKFPYGDKIWEDVLVR